MWRHLYAIGKDFSFITWMFWHKMFRNINHVTLAWWQVLLHLHHSLLNCALDFVNFYLFDILFEFTGENVNIKPIQLELWNSVMKSGYAILELNFKTGSEFRTVLYGKNFQVFSRKTLFEKQKTWWFVSIHLCICAHVEVPLSSSLVEVWLAKNYVNIVMINKMAVNFFKITVIS